MNYEAGAKTPLAAVFAGLLLMAIIIPIAPFASYLPNAAMAGILFLVAWGVIDFHHIKKVLKTSRSEAAIMATTFFAALFLELEFAIFLGVILSLVIYLNRTSRPRIYARVPDPRLPRRKFNTDPALPECPQLKIVRIDGSLFFGAVNHVRETLRRIEEHNPNQKHLAIIATGINFIDLAGAEFLAEEARKRREGGGGLYMIRVKEGVCEPFRRGGYLEEIGDENIFRGKTDALAAIFDRLDRDICERCTARIFNECQSVPGPFPARPPEPTGRGESEGGDLDSAAQHSQKA